MPALEESYRHCRRVTRTRAKNFYYAFILLPRPELNAVCALYAFMRYCDDLSDEPGARSEPLERLRRELDAAFAGALDTHLFFPALIDAATRYQIPRPYLHDMISGVSSDLERPRRIQTFDELYRYCYQVASVAGMSTMHVLGVRSDEGLALAEKCGIAFQLTNILRDVREDAERDRVYLPREDLERFGVDPGDFLAGHMSAAFVELMRFEAARAHRYYRESAPLVGLVDSRGRQALAALIGIYSGLLDKIERSGYDVLAGRISLSAPAEAWIAARAALAATAARPRGASPAA